MFLDYKMKTNLNEKSISLITQIISIFLVISSVLYYAGLLFKYHYFNSLGLSKDLFAYQNKDLLLVGFRECLFLLPLTSIFFGRLYLFSRIRKNKKEGKEQLKDLINMKKEGLDLQSTIKEPSQIKKLDNLLEVITKLEDEKKDLTIKLDKVEEDFVKDCTSGWLKKILLQYFLVFAFISLCVSYFISNNLSFYSFLDVLIQGVGIVCGYIIYSHLVSIMIKRDIFSSVNAIHIFPLIILTILLILPAFHGFTQAKIDLKNNDFKKVIVFQEKENFEAGYIYSDTNKYIFRINDKFIVIPSFQILKIQFK